MEMSSSTQAQPPPIAASPPILIPSDFMEKVLAPDRLIPHLRTTIPILTHPSSSTPHRQSFLVGDSSTLLLMPSFSTHASLPYIGVKLLTHFPSNAPPTPSIHASYALFSSLSGSPIAYLDGTLLTLLRTSAVSALASSFLSRPSSSTLVLVGAGALSPYLFRAHISARPGISKTLVWNRTPGKSLSMVETLRACVEFDGRVRFEVAEQLEEAVREGDIVSCATSSEEPLVKGEWLKVGAHLDLVGSYTRQMRECDDTAMLRARGRVYVDCKEAAEEAGEIAGAVERGAMGRDDVEGTLTELVTGTKMGRRSVEEVTVFKSVGNAGWDLAAAQLVYEDHSLSPPVMLADDSFVS
ncbi:hypothetical protein MLD38_025692 [Melastoma candidum]|uniref:Uncharacterized protein n=1 Tax=Melastoma candidum TaxID=119954 RepID=A0ACB9NWL5_9MYRT|nr:hypothetical protein MLD38_025692 [Melastoma candidum]